MVTSYILLCATSQLTFITHHKFLQKRTHAHASEPVEVHQFGLMACSPGELIYSDLVGTVAFVNAAMEADIVARCLHKRL